jgi:hypothetical protein
MVERKVKVQMPDGKSVDGFDVPVRETVERATEITLEDGSILRLKVSILGAIRLAGQYDPEGNPMYVLKATNAMIVAEAPAALKRGQAPEPAKAN